MKHRFGTSSPTTLVLRLASLLALSLFVACSPAPADLPVTLSVSPATATATVGGAAVTFTATLANSSAAISWTLAGPGSLSAATGSSVSYTPPASGSASNAVVTAAAAGKSASATITIEEAGTPGDTVELEKGLIAEFLTYETWNNRVLPDSSGAGNDGYTNSSGSSNIESATDRPGFANRAFNFRGNDPGQPSILEIRSSPTGDGNVPYGVDASFAIWVGSDSINREGFLIGPKDADISESPGLVNDSTVAFEVPLANGGAGFTITDPNPLPLGSNSQTQWAFYVVTIDREGAGATIGLYRDGSLIEEATLADASTIPTAAPVMVGARTSYDSNSRLDNFQGFLDDIRVYNRVLNPSEIKALFDQLPPPS